MKDDIELIYRQEQDLLDPACRKNPDLLAALLAEEMIEVGSDGCLYEYEEILTALQKEDAIPRQLSDFQARVLTPAIIQTIYIAEKRNKDGHIQKSLRTSLWKKYPDGWKMIFHQGSIRIKK